MSDFDKEAEREKLREKYDRDREKRKETERMSQLLLQGATMTNRHCGSCGDPLFRYEGSEFCATCEGQAEETAAEDTTRTDAATDTTADGSTGAAEPATGDATDGATSGEVAGDAAGHPSPEQVAGGDAGSSTATERPVNETTRSSPTPTATATTSDPSAGTATTDDGRVEGDLDAARASLARTLTIHAQRAEAAEGPRRAADHLAAVREAAEALSALDESRR